MPKLGIKDLGFDEIQSQIDAISQSLEAAAKKLDSFMASGGENTSLKEQVSILKEIYSLQQKQTSLIKKQTVDNKQLSASEKALENVKKRQSVLNSKEASEISNINLS